MAKEDRAALASTIAATGFTDAIPDAAIKAFSPACPEENKFVHSKTNERLLASLLDDSPGQCIHVTGEMRALADPYHRRLCAELVKRSSTRFVILYNIPKEFSESPEGVGNWNSQRWTSKSWVAKLSAINLIGEAFVDVRAFNTLGEIQYSVFGNRYVQLQERHVDEGSSKAPAAKRIWLIDSERLNGFLAARASSMIGQSKDIPESLFKRYLARVSGVTAQNILTKLAVNSPVSTELILNNALLDFDPDAAKDLDILSGIGFVTVDQQSLVAITPEGRQFVETLG